MSVFDVIDGGKCPPMTETERLREDIVMKALRWCDRGGGVWEALEVLRAAQKLSNHLS